MRITRLEYDTMVAVHEFAQQNNLNCDNLRCQTIDVFYDAAQLEKAHASVAQMEELMGSKAPKHTFHDAEDTAKTYFSHKSVGSLEYESGSLSAYKFTIGVLKLALKKGLNLQCNTSATSISKNADGSWTTQTLRGSLTCRKLILATNGYTAHLYPALQGVIVPLRGVITAQRPGHNLPQTGLETTYSFVHASSFEYMISRPQGTKFEGDIVIGGGHHVAKDDGLDEYGNTDDTAYDEASAAYLLDITKKVFDKDWAADHPEGQCRKTWSGVMGFSSDGYPFVGPVPGEDGLYLDVSFQGHGMVLCFLCAKAVVQMITGNDAELDTWFPKCYRVMEERMQKQFRGKTLSGAPEPPIQNGH